MNTRFLAAGTTLLLVAGVGLAVPSQAAAAAKSTRTTVVAGKAVVKAKVTLTAAVTPSPGGGTVRFTASGRTVAKCAKVALRSGRATCTTTFPSAGRRTVTAAYSGRAKAYKASSARRVVTVTAAPKAAPSRVGTVVGSTGSCTLATGALVAVSFGKWSGPIVRGCDTTPTKGNDLLSTAGFGITQVQRQPGFVCRLGHPLFDSAKQYPGSTESACVTTPPSSAYWSYWLAAKGANTWTYASLGAYSQTATDGQVQAWTFGTTDVNGTTGRPTFTPDQIRAGVPASAAALRVARARSLAAPTTPDLDKAAGYVVDELVDGTHYEDSERPDYGLTIDAALALAGAGSRDEQLGRITDYVAAHVDDYTFLNEPPGDAGRVGKVALLAEATGRSPRTFGGVDLIAALGTLECAEADAAKGCGAAGGYPYVSSTFGQVLAVLALLRAGGEADAPVRYLESVQDGSGAFPSDLGGGYLETDSTAMAAMALALVPGKSARTALARALSWLAGRQQANGSFPGASGDSINSAALSIQALTLDAETYAPQIAKGRQFLGSAQNDDGGFDIAAGVDGSNVRSSTQALGGAALVPFGSVLRDLRSQTEAAKGADYLVAPQQLTDGDHYSASYVDDDGNTITYDDQGLTADGVFALLGAGGHADTVAEMVTYLRGQVVAYADPDGGKKRFRGPFSGQLAKLALVAESTNGDAHAFGGYDLLTVLAGNVCPAAIDGADSPCTAKGDFYSVFSEIGQALGVLALQASPVASDHLTFDSSPVVRLRQLQCADGGFTPELITGKAACGSTPDATGFAVQALATVPGADAVLGRAQHYLEKAQKATGVYEGEAGENSNSTALASTGLQTLVTALHSETVDPPGPKTIAPITNLQRALAGLHTFAVPAGGYDVQANGAADVRASTQAVLAASQGSLVTLTGARIASTPRDAVVVDPGTPPPGGTPPTTGPGGGANPAGSGDPVAATGVTTATQLGWALAFVLGGVLLAFAGRRRVAEVVGRHRHAHGR